MKKFTNAWIIASNKRKIAGTMLLFLCVLHPLYSQRTQIYSGPYKDGEAKYEYYDTQKGRVYHGDFSFSFSDTSRSIEINGTFKNDLRDGLWKYICAIKTEEGIVHKLTFDIEYKNGIRDGKYEHVYMKGGKTIRNFKTTTKNGLIDGAFVFNEIHDYDKTTEKIRGYYVLGCRGGRWVFQEFKDSGKNLHITQYSDYKEDCEYYVNNETGTKVDGRYNSFSISGESVSYYYTIHYIKGQFLRMESLLGVRNTSLGLHAWGGEFKILPYDDTFLNNNVKEAKYLKGILYPLKINEDTTKKELSKKLQTEMQKARPTFYGGQEALEKFLQEKATKSAHKLKITKKTSSFVNCVIEADGTMTNVKTATDKHQPATDIAVDEEALRIVKSLPRWNPAKWRGKNIRCQMTIKVTFLPLKNNKGTYMDY